MSTQVLASAFLRWCCGLLDESSRPWGDAMLAELEYVRGSAERLRWALGGVMVMMRMLLKQWFHSGTPSFAEGDVLMGGPQRPRRRWPPILFAAIAVVLFLLPQVRQAIGVVFGSVASSHQLYTSRLKEYSPVSESQLARIASEGRKTRNAKLLAIAAINSSDINHQRAWTDEAIALDANQTWVDYVVASRAAVRAHNRNFTAQEQSDYLVDGRRRVAVLEQWDPDNAVPYLLEAQIVVKDQEIFIKAAQDESLLNSEPEWLAAMQKGFSAPRYDSYINRRFDLTRAAPQAFGTAAPWATLLGLAGHPIPNLLGLRSYANYLVGQDARVRWVVGSNSDPRASTGPALVPKDLPPGFGDQIRIANYWKVGLFGERMQMASTDIEKLIGVSLQTIGYRPLLVALQKSGQQEQADAIAYRLREIDRFAREFQNPGRRSERNTFIWLAVLTSIGSFVALASAVALVFATGYKLARTFWGSANITRIDRITRSILYSGPVWFLVSSVVVLICYWPFAQAYQTYLSSKSVPDIESLYTIFGGFASAPYVFAFSMNGRGGVVTWSALSIVLSAIALWRLSHVFRNRTALLA